MYYHFIGLKILPGNFFGFLKGTNLAPIAKAIGGPKINPLASIPEKYTSKQTYFNHIYHHQCVKETLD